MIEQINTNPSNEDLKSILSRIRNNSLNKEEEGLMQKMPAPSRHLSDQQINEINTALHNSATNDRIRLLLGKSENKTRLKQSLAEYIMNWECNWDIDLSLLVPRGNKAYNSQVHLSKFLHGYFKAIDAVVYGHISSRLRPKLNRFVVTEHADGVGWHCHAIIATPVHFDRAALDNVMRRIWFERIGIYDNPKFNPDRFYCSNIHNDAFIKYSLKYAIDTNNLDLDLSKGVIDLYNTSYDKF